jgi:CubicO group peptidase (beta-lactamase class C family)
VGLPEVSDWIAERLPRVLEEHDVPAAVVAVLADGQVVEHAAGILGKRTRVAATTDSLFQIGSITKLWTATLTLQLVDEGLVELDGPVCDYLPEFRVADAEATRVITVRQLLTHTSGFEGDRVIDTGPGDDCLERFVALLRDARQIVPPATMASYNSAGFIVLGRLVEVLRGQPYDACLRDRLIDPLGITQAATDAYRAILFRTAVGHVRPAKGAPCEPVAQWCLPRSNAPTGAMLAMSARGLLAFARMQLDDGRAPDGTALLRPGTAAVMQMDQDELPHLNHLGTSWGYGFERWETDDGLVIGHDGKASGQSAYLRMSPETGVAVAVLTNSARARPVFSGIGGHVIHELVGHPMPRRPHEPVTTTDSARPYRTRTPRDEDLTDSGATAARERDSSDRPGPASDGEAAP